MYTLWAASTILGICMMGKPWSAALMSAALITVGAAGPARADSSPAVRVSLYSERDAYGVATTMHFLLETNTKVYFLVDEPGYAAAAEQGLARIDLLADDELIGTATGTPWAINWDPSARPEGSVRLTMRAYDQAGRTFDSTSTVSVDHTAPQLRVVQNGYLKAGGDVYFEVADRTRITRTDLLAGDRIVDSAQALNGILSWDQHAVDGPAKLTVRARDAAGNLAEYHRTVLVDNVRPVVSVAPAAGAYVRGIAPFTLTSLRDASGLAEFDVFISGLGTSAGPRIVRADTRRVADGPHAVQWWAYDRAGNVTTIRRTVTVDNHAPTVAFATAPKTTARMTKSFAVTAKASDHFGITRVQLLVNGKVVATDTKPGYRFTIKPTRYGKKFTVQLRAYDRAGNLKDSSKHTYHR